MEELLIGREKDLKTLKLCYESQESEFVAVYGRRRVGKTFLIRQRRAEILLLTSI